MRRVNHKNENKRLLLKMFDKYLKKSDTLYDIGCGTKYFAKHTKDKVTDHIGVDLDEGFYDKSHIDIIGSAYDVPVADGVADVVLSSQVMEHLDRPEDAVKETARLLKKGGYFICSFPFMYPIHAAPHDYQRLTEFAMNKYLKDHGFEVVEMHRVGGFWFIVGIYFQMYLQTFNVGFLRKTYLIPAIAWLFAWGFTLIHTLEGAILSLAGNKAINAARHRWTNNYVFVAQKK